MKQILEVDFQANDIQTVLLKLVILYICIHIGYAFFKNARNIKVNQTMAKILKDIRTDAFDKVLRFKMKTFEKYNSSQLYTRLTNDINELFNLFFGVLNVVVNNIVYLLFMVIMMFFANISLAWIGLAIISVIGMSTMKFTNVLGNIRKKFLKKRDLLNREFSEFYNKSKLTYLYQMQEKNIEKSEGLFSEELRYRKRYIFVHHFTYWVLTLLEAVGIYSVLYYALNIDLSISVGSVYLILFYIKECRSPLNEICNQLEEIQNCLVSYQRIKEILKEKDPEDIEVGEEVEIVKGDIEFQNVSMKYQKETVLKNVSFIIKEGAKVTIAGRTGAGKSTLVNVLMKMYDIQSGKIRIGNKDIHKISTKSLRDNISYISQNPYIFVDTVRNNIRLGNQEITDKQITDLAKEIGAEGLLKKLPQGLDTKIKANEMSYGELQINTMQRIFTFLTGMTVTEYIRRRRLSKAAEELRKTDHKIIDIAMKYQYDSPVSFSNAFKKMHGKSPNHFRKSNLEITFFPRMEFNPNIKGRKEMKYRIMDLEEETFYGKTTGLIADNDKKSIQDLYKQARRRWNDEVYYKS